MSVAWIEGTTRTIRLPTTRSDRSPASTIPKVSPERKTPSASCSVSSRHSDLQAVTHGLYTSFPLLFSIASGVCAFVIKVSHLRVQAHQLEGSQPFSPPT